MIFRLNLTMLLINLYVCCVLSAGSFFCIEELLLIFQITNSTPSQENVESIFNTLEKIVLEGQANQAATTAQSTDVVGSTILIFILFIFKRLTQTLPSFLLMGFHYLVGWLMH